MTTFVDYAKIFCRSGNGGAGSVSFRREKHVPRGGPDGGDGGKGGDIILQGDLQKWTLLDLKFKRHYYAENGDKGMGGLKTGSGGKSIVIQIPPGTIAKDARSGEILCEITKHNEKEILLRGGRGGLGNNHFKTSTRQTPQFAQPGEKGEQKEIILELKLLADVGLIGFPNAGKSTLLSVITAAKPKIADYPFTTLVPNLGIVQYKNYNSFVVADIPGIIEGASEGKGLGLRFLRHIERNSILLFMISCENGDVNRNYKILLNELKKYNPELLKKDRMLAVTKCDLRIDEKSRKKLKKTFPKGIKTIFISSLTGEGLDELKDLLWKFLNPKQ